MPNLPIYQLEGHSSQVLTRLSDGGFGRTRKTHWGEWWRGVEKAAANAPKVFFCLPPVVIASGTHNFLATFFLHQNNTNHRAYGARARHDGQRSEC